VAPSVQLRWFQETAQELAGAFLHQWIAIDGGRLEAGARSPEEVVVAHGRTFDELLVATNTTIDRNDRLCFAFVEMPLVIRPRQIVR